MSEESTATETAIIDIEAARQRAIEALASGAQSMTPIAPTPEPKKARTKKAEPAIEKTGATGLMLGKTRFVSRTEETVLFDVKLATADGGFKTVRGGWLPDRTRIEWWVPDEIVDTMRAHFFVRDQRIIED